MSAPERAVDDKTAAPAALEQLSELERLRARGRVRGLLPMLGPAFVAAVAYVDPGNFATNISGGAEFGYLLLWVILAANLAPALVVLAAGADPTASLVLSQVVLSFGIPFALVPLVLLTRNRDVMGEFVNNRATTAVASVVAALIISLNVFLLYDTFLG